MKPEDEVPKPVRNVLKEAVLALFTVSLILGWAVLTLIALVEAFRWLFFT